MFLSPLCKNVSAATNGNANLASNKVTQRSAIRAITHARKMHVIE